MCERDRKRLCLGLSLYRSPSCTNPREAGRHPEGARHNHNNSVFQPHLHTQNHMSAQSEPNGHSQDLRVSYALFSGSHLFFRSSFPCPLLHLLSPPCVCVCVCCALSSSSSIPVVRMMVEHSKLVPDHKALFSLYSSFSFLALSLSVSPLLSFPPLLTTVQFNLQWGLSGTAAGLPHHYVFLLPENLLLFFPYCPLCLRSSKAMNLFNHLFIFRFPQKLSSQQCLSDTHLH